MRVVGVYSFKGGKEIIEADFAVELAEVKEIIRTIDASLYRTKTSREKTMPGKVLYSPTELNTAYSAAFEAFQWRKGRVLCQYSNDFYLPDFTSSISAQGAYREIDFVKNRVGVEVQFGKYAFMVYNVCAKMTIFHNLGIIDVGIEIVPVKDLADDMSTGVSYFEQFVWDLEHRGVADIDIPVLIYGIAAE